MFRSSKFLSGRSSLLPLLLLASTVTLNSCSQIPFLGGGPNVAANVQAGRENTQQIVGQQTRTEIGRDLIRKDFEAGPVESLTIRNQNIPPWVLLLLLIGWLLPSPGEIGRMIRGAFRGKV